MKTLPALGIAFVVLRLCEVIAWSWWWVLAPFWIPLAVGLPAAILMLVFGSNKTRIDLLKRIETRFK